MNEPIEILEGVFYDPNKEWYEQPIELITLGLDIEKTQPTNFEMETNGNHERFKYGIWQYTTNLGTFEMRVDITYLSSISARNFMTKKLDNKVTIKTI